jgi:hypothetical protein
MKKRLKFDCSTWELNGSLWDVDTLLRNVNEMQSSGRFLLILQVEASEIWEDFKQNRQRTRGNLELLMFVGLWQRQRIFWEIKVGFTDNESFNTSLSVCLSVTWSKLLIYYLSVPLWLIWTLQYIFLSSSYQLRSLNLTSYSSLNPIPNKTATSKQICNHFSAVSTLPPAPISSYQKS